MNIRKAEIVKRIFREYLEGASCKKIGRGLERDGILTVRGSSRWHDSTIRKILENEKYMAALQQELIDRTSRRENYDDLAEEILHLREVQAQTVMDDAAKAEHKKRIRELQAFIRSQPHGITEFDETLVKHLVERVTVQEEYLVFRFRSGVEVVVEK